MNNFKNYWTNIGKPPLEILIDGAWIACNPLFTPGKVYRIAGDTHWELRNKWIESGFTLPIESKAIVGPFRTDLKPCWIADVDYREAKQVIESSLLPEPQSYPEYHPHKDPGEHYRVMFNGFELDPYEIACAYGMTDQMQFTILKKVLKAGKRGHKDERQDMLDIINAAQRRLRKLN
jgi:hypothetical protein